MVLAHRLLKTDMGAGELPFDVAVHLGTLVAVLVYFRTDVRRMLVSARRLLLKVMRLGGVGGGDDEAKRLVLFVMIATVPTAVVGLALKEPMGGLREAHREALFLITVGLLFLNGVLLGGSDWMKAKGRSVLEVPLYAALAVGIAQGVAVMPGISRSGATVLAALAVGFSRSNAARVSFLCAIPAIAGAGLVEMVSAGGALKSLGAVPLIVGMVAAFGVGLPAIFVLISILKRAQLKYFGVYCVVVSVLALIAAR